MINGLLCARKKVWPIFGHNPFGSALVVLWYHVPTAWLCKYTMKYSVTSNYTKGLSSQIHYEASTCGNDPLWFCPSTHGVRSYFRYDDVLMKYSLWRVLKLPYFIN